MIVSTFARLVARIPEYVSSRNLVRLGEGVVCDGGSKSLSSGQFPYVIRVLSELVYDRRRKRAAQLEVVSHPERGLLCG